MRVTVVGSGDAFCSGGRGTTCFHVEANGFRMAIDYGASAQLGCKSLGLKVEELDAVVLSHLHGDHFGGLPFLILDGQMGARRARPLRIFGPPGHAGAPPCADGGALPRHRHQWLALRLVRGRGGARHAG